MYLAAILGLPQVKRGKVGGGGTSKSLKYFLWLLENLPVNAMVSAMDGSKEVL